jgi:hypothetical protein
MRDVQSTGTETYTTEVLTAVMFRLPSFVCDSVQERFTLCLHLLGNQVTVMEPTDQAKLRYMQIL